MKKILLAAALISLSATSAFAADLAVKAHPMYTKAPLVVADSWTGFYIGAIGGYASGPSHTDPTGVLPAIGAYPVDLTVKGGFAGGQLGYDYQLPNGVVFGLVGDMSWAHLTGSACAEVGPARCSDGQANDSFAKGTVNWLSTVRGKLGFAIAPQVLLYATGGVAFVGTKARDTYINGFQDVTSSATLTGGTVGAGLEYKITHNISFGLEYLYADFGKHTYIYDTSNIAGFQGLQVSTDTSLKLNVAKAALNFHF